MLPAFLIYFINNQNQSLMKRVLTGFTHLDDGELDIDAANAVSGLTGNAILLFQARSFLSLHMLPPLTTTAWQI